MKGISTLEQHVEKIVLGIAILILLAAFYTQFIAQPHSINEGSPSEVKEKVLDEIEGLRRRLDGPSNVPDYAVSGFREHFAQAVEEEGGASVQMPRLALGQLPPPPLGDIGEAPLYNLPTPPVTRDLEIAHGHALLATDAGGAGNVTNEIIQLVGGRPPYDIQYVSVAATFPFAEWVRRLESGPVRDRVPPRWWGSRRLLAGVVLQRQELDPATGQWSEPVVIQPIPGQLGYIEDRARNWEPGEVQQALTALSGQQAFVQQPPFVPTRAGVPWTPPGEGLASLDATTHRELRGLFEDLDTTRERLARLQEREQRTQNRPERETPNRRPSAGPGMGGMGDPGMGGIGGPGAARPAPNLPNRPQPTSQLERLQQQEQEVIQEIMAILMPEQAEEIRNRNAPAQPGPAMGGMGMGGMGGPAGGFGGPGPVGGRVNPGNQQTSSAITEPTVRVWAHDITVQPGKTYRYRVIANVLNPLFRRSNVQKEQRDQNYRKIALGPSDQELAGAPWSEPVTMDPSTVFWLADGSLQQQEAEIEIWTRFAGRWERLEERFRPGDAIAGSATIQGPLGVQALNMNTGSIMIDYASLGAGAASAALLYTDETASDLATRTVDNDRSNIDYVRLLNEVDAIDFLTEFGSGRGIRGPGPGMPQPGMGGMGGGMGGPVF